MLNSPYKLWSSQYTELAASIIICRGVLRNFGVPNEDLIDHRNIGIARDGIADIMWSKALDVIQRWHHMDEI